jgi:hypothetical protein
MRTWLGENWLNDTGRWRRRIGLLAIVSRAGFAL